LLPKFWQKAGQQQEEDGTCTYAACCLQSSSLAV
jgi:hypothetical protein